MEKHLSVSMHPCPSAKHACLLTCMFASAFWALALLVVYVRAHQITLACCMLHAPGELQSAGNPGVGQRAVAFSASSSSEDIIPHSPSTKRYGIIRMIPTWEIRSTLPHAILHVVVNDKYFMYLRWMWVLTQEICRVGGMLNKDPESGRKSQCQQPGQCVPHGTMIGHRGGHKTGCDCRQQLPTARPWTTMR